MSNKLHLVTAWVGVLGIVTRALHLDSVVPWMGSGEQHHAVTLLQVEKMRLREID